MVGLRECIGPIPVVLSRSLASCNDLGGLDRRIYGYLRGGGLWHEREGYRHEATRETKPALRGMSTNYQRYVDHAANAPIEVSPAVS